VFFLSTSKKPKQVLSLQYTVGMFYCGKTKKERQISHNKRNSFQPYIDNPIRDQG